MSDVTRILSAIEQGDPHAAEQLLPLVYDELRKLAAQRLAQEKPGQTLQATALVHEAYLRLVGRRAGPALEQPRPLLRRRRRGHAPHPRRARPPQAGRQARRRPAARRPRRAADVGSTAPPDDLLALDEALTRLAARGPAGRRAGQAPLLRRPDDRARRPRRSASRARTADRHWAYARAWLHAPAATAERRAGRLTNSPFPGRFAAAILALHSGEHRPGRRAMTVDRERSSDLPATPSDSRRRTSGPAYLDRGLRRRRRAARRGRGAAAGPRRGRQLPGAAGRRPGRHRRRSRVRERPGTVIGPYKLLEQIGEGGMGTVWMAQQTEPVKRAGRRQAHQGRAWTPGRCSPASRPSGRPWP